jgi:hypothetical protein
LCRHQPTGNPEPERRHVVVVALVLAGADEIGLVPDADVAVAGDGLIERLPRRMVVLASGCFTTAAKPLENQRFLKRASRVLAAIIGTEGHQSAPSGAESPEKVPNHVLQAFTGAATHRRAPVRDGQSAPNECRDGATEGGTDE